MSPLRRALTLVSLVVLACSRPLGPEQAAEQLRARHPDLVLSRTIVAESELGELRRLQLIQYTPGDFFRKVSPRVSLSAGGTAAGLAVTVDSFLRDYRQPRVSGSLCTRTLGRVTALVPEDRGGTPVTTAHYTLQHTGQTDFYRAIAGSSIPVAYCHPDSLLQRQALFVTREGQWTLDQPPQFPDSLGSRIKTSFEYDGYGRVVGAVSELSVARGATDPDGDSVLVSWAGRYYPGDGDSMTTATLDTAGLRANWRRIIRMGRPVGGAIYLIATDSWGVADSFRFCLEGYRFAC